MKLLALPIAIALLVHPAATSADTSMRFPGRVEPSRTVVIANHVNGVVEDLRFSGGEDVAAGDILAVIDPRTFEIALEVARAALAEAGAVLRLAEDDARRQAELLARNTGSRVAALRAEIARDTARAQHDRRRAEVDAATLALERTTISAPTGGTISPPRLAEGAFVEAKAGTALGEIVILDPVRVAYQVPYAEREQALARAGVRTPAALFERIELSLTLPSGEPYPHPGHPLFESAAIDPDTGALPVWGPFPNPDRTLVPFLAVEITASLRADGPRDRRP